MTNAELYIGDESMIDQFIDEFNEFACERDIDFKYHYLKEMLVEFFKQKRPPFLTEDERVILRNVDKEWITIARPFKHNLELRDTLPEADKIIKWSSLEPFNHLFQFIKERRRI